jgi:hypothetical protein
MPLLVALLLIVGCSHTPNLPTTPSNKLETTELERANSLRKEGIALYEKGSYLEAIPPLETSLWLEPGHNDIQFLLYYCYLSTGDYKQAKRVAEAIAKSFPFQSLSYQQIGLAELWSGNKSEAFRNLTRAKEFEFHQPKLHFYLGLASDTADSRDKAFQTAEEEYEEVLKKNSKDFTANFELASLYLYWNKNLERIPSLLIAAKANLIDETEEFPEERGVLLKFHFPLLEGILAYRKGDPNTSINKLLSALAEAPQGATADLAELYYYMAASQAALDNTGTAKMLYEKSLSLAGKGPFAAEAKKELRAISSENISP